MPDNDNTDELSSPHERQKDHRPGVFSPQPDKSALMHSLFSFEQVAHRGPSYIQQPQQTVSVGATPPPRPESPLPQYFTPAVTVPGTPVHPVTPQTQTSRPGQLFMSYRPPPPPPTLDRPLQLFNLSDFHLLRTLGTGTFGRVRLAKYRGLDKFFAMKVMRKADVLRLKQEKHVMNERWLLAKLNFPFIVRLYAAFQDTKSLYLLLEYAIGGELYSYLRKAGRFSLPTCKFYAAEIMMALEYLHSMDIAYRDLKPENLLLDARGHVKLSDFGFAKVVSDRTWTLCGTPEYLAPEIIANRGHGKAVDWWALGVLIYEMLAGYPPFYDKTPFATYERILAGRLVFPPHFDACTQDLIRRLLQPDPSLRLGNLQGGAQDLRRHPWFAGVDWHGLYKRTIMAPIQPRIQHPGDTACFERYSEEEAEEGADMTLNQDIFKGF